MSPSGGEGYSAGSSSVALCEYACVDDDAAMVVRRKAHKNGAARIMMHDARATPHVGMMFPAGI